MKKETKQEDKLLTIFEGIIFLFETAGITLFRFSRKYVIKKQNEEENNNKETTKLTEDQVHKKLVKQK